MARSKEELVEEVSTISAGDELSINLKKIIVAYIERAYSIGFNQGVEQAGEIQKKIFEAFQLTGG